MKRGGTDASSAFRIVPGQPPHQIERGTIGCKSRLDRVVVRLNRTTHFVVRGAERAKRLVVGIEQRAELPIDVRIHLGAVLLAS